MEDTEDGGFVLVPREGEEHCSCACKHGRRNGDESLEYMPDIDKFVDSLTEPLWSLNKFIHANPELAFHEHKAHRALTDFMQAREEGWQVTPSAYGMGTAWVAMYDSGRPGPAVSFNVEMDALPGLGHACGHNLIAAASLAAGLATAATMRRRGLPGRVLIFGTPGEEVGYGAGKIRLLERGAYHGVDVSLISHPGILHNNPLVRTTAFARLEVEFRGRPAHAARAPWRGVNALDAFVVAYAAVAALRQQTVPGDIISLDLTSPDSTNNNNSSSSSSGYLDDDHPNHDSDDRTTTTATTATNIKDNALDPAGAQIPSRASCTCSVRSSAGAARLAHLLAQLRACFRAGGLATGADVRVRTVAGCRDHVPNRVLARRYTRHWNALPPCPAAPPPGPAIPVVPPPTCGGGGGGDDDDGGDDGQGQGQGQGQVAWIASGTDQGDVSYAVPSVNASFAIPPGPGGGQPHSADFERAAGTREAFERALRVGKALAGTAVDVLARPGLVDEVRRQWRRDMEAAKDWDGGAL